MSPQPISQIWICTNCGLANEIYPQPDFKTICLDLLAGKTGLLICGGCQHTERIRLVNSTLEMVVG